MKKGEMKLLAERMVKLGLLTSDEAAVMSDMKVLEKLIYDCISGEAREDDFLDLEDEGIRQRREFKVSYIPYLWGTLEELLLDHGFKKEVVNRKESNVNVVYRHDDVPYVVIIVKNMTYNIDLPLLMDRADYDALSMKDNGKRTVIYFRSGGGSRDGELRFQLGAVKLHRLVVMNHNKDFDDKSVVDHVAVSPSICTSEYVREATSAQNNSCHILMPCKPADDKLSFAYTSGSKAMIQAVEELMQDAAFKGFTHVVRRGKVSVQSPQYSSEKDMYKALEEFENRLFGEFRYDPLIACPKSISVFLMILWKVGILTDTEYWNARMHEYFCRGALDMLTYYGL